MGARFICEHCGASVKRDSKSCPKCGRPFANVLCPVCGFEGAERLFSAGCPSCGYTSEAPVRGAASKHEKEPPPRFAAGDLPVWAYVLAVLAFVSVLALLLKYLR